MTSKITNPLNDKISDTNVIFSPGHHTLIMTAINMFKDKPLFGHGPKLYRELCNNIKYKYNDNSCSTHPHNNYIQALSNRNSWIRIYFNSTNVIIIKNIKSFV